jgi:hypothetical protein
LDSLQSPKRNDTKKKQKIIINVMINNDQTKIDNNDEWRMTNDDNDEDNEPSSREESMES